MSCDMVVRSCDSNGRKRKRKQVPPAPRSIRPIHNLTLEIISTAADVRNAKSLSFKKQETFQFVSQVVDFNHETAQKIFRGLVKSHVLMFVSKKADNYDDIISTATKLAGSDAYRNKVF